MDEGRGEVDEHVSLRAVVECRSGYDAEPWHVVEVSGGESSLLVADDSFDGREIWIACGMLPAFMDVRKYGK